MPTYQYICRNCRNELEELQTMSEPPLVNCPSCGQDTLARVMGLGGGVIFKGSGFYLTDYAKTSGKESATKLEKKTGDKTEAGAAAPTTETKTSEPKKDPPPSPDTKKD
jgi:putative FmdB family regulatory protein